MLYSQLSAIIMNVGAVNSSVPIQVDTSTATLTPHASMLTELIGGEIEVMVQPVLFTASLVLSSPQDINLAPIRNYVFFFDEELSIGNFDLQRTSTDSKGIDGYYPSGMCVCVCHACMHVYVHVCTCMCVFDLSPSRCSGVCMYEILLRYGGTG